MLRNNSGKTCCDILSNYLKKQKSSRRKAESRFAIAAVSRQIKASGVLAEADRGAISACHPGNHCLFDTCAWLVFA
jgi:hypothetical protein